MESNKAKDEELPWQKSPRHWIAQREKFSSWKSTSVTRVGITPCWFETLPKELCMKYKKQFSCVINSYNMSFTNLTRPSFGDRSHFDDIILSLNLSERIELEY